jgi:hypothetical protein
MRLDIAPWTPTATALELIPCRRVRPSRAYFEAGHDLLDRLTRALPARVPARPRRSTGATSATITESLPGSAVMPLTVG